MLRLIIFACLVRFAGGITIRGQIIPDGQTNQAIPIPDGSRLYIELSNAPHADDSSIPIKEVVISNFAFPFNYELEIPDDTLPASTYRLSARITNGEKLLYITDTIVPVQIGAHKKIQVDLPVVTVRRD